jgi:hypothetical protein
MEMNEEKRGLGPLKLMLKWNQYCDATGREGDCILLSEERTFDEADVLNDILNREDLKRKEGFLIPVYWDDRKYRGMRWVAEDDIGKRIDMDCIDKA